MNIVPLNPEAHAGVKLRPGVDLSIAENQHAMPLVGHEFAAAATSFPVVFLKNSETGQFQPVAMLGLETGENLFIEDGKWDTHHFPQLAMAFPFKLIPSAHDDTQMMLGIDEDCTLVNKEEGELLFNEDGTESEYLAARKNAAVQIFEQSRMTHFLIEKLAELELLESRSMNFEINGTKSAIDGFYSVDEKKLNELSEEVFADLRKQGYLAVIYAHMVSMHQLGALVKRKARRMAAKAG